MENSPLNRSKIETTNALQCQVPVWGDHTIGPRTAKNGDNYCTALKRNMEGAPMATWCSEWICRKGWGLVHHKVIIPPTWCFLLLLGDAICHAPTILPIDRFCDRFSSFYNSPVFAATSFLFFVKYLIVANCFSRHNETRRFCPPT